MKRVNPFQNKILQFSYDHRKLDRQLNKVRKSANEVNQMLNNMAGKGEKSGDKQER